MPDVPITVNPPHFARPRAARIVAIRYCVIRYCAIHCLTVCFGPCDAATRLAGGGLRLTLLC